MKIECKNNRVFFENNGSKKEIHPFWLRERVNGDIFVDKNTQQRLFDPTGLQNNIQINSLNVSNNYLEISFSDGVQTKLAIENLVKDIAVKLPPVVDETCTGRLAKVFEELSK